MDALIVRSARTAEGPMMLMISGHVDCDLPKADRDRLFDYDAGVLYGILRKHIPSGTYYALVERIMEDRP